jgi:hypothetical protein
MKNAQRLLALTLVLVVAMVILQACVVGDPNALSEDEAVALTPANCAALETPGGVYNVCDVVTPQGVMCAVIVRSRHSTDGGAISASIDCDWES